MALRSVALLAAIPAAAAASAASIPVKELICDLVKDPEVEKKVMDKVCGIQHILQNCADVLPKVYDVLESKVCGATAEKLKVFPNLWPEVCKLVQNKDIEQMAVAKACSLQHDVKQSECELGLTTAWDHVVSDECKTHVDRLTQIQEIKNTLGVLWTASSVERFASEAPGASKTLNGVKGDWSKQIEEAVARGEVHRFTDEMLGPLGATQSIPDHFDSAENWPQCGKIIDDIRDQSNCGCCWAFGAAEAASDRMCIATNGSLQVPLSAQDVCFCAREDGCGGGNINDPWNYIKNNGAVSGGQFKGSGPFGKGMCLDFSMPHCHHYGPQGDDPFPAEGKPGCMPQTSPQCAKTCDADAADAHKDFTTDKYSFDGKIVTAGCIFGLCASGVQKLIMAGGPVETAFAVYSDFENYAGGIYHHVSGECVGAHAVKIVGWGVENSVKYWKVANSWNSHWGEKGYFRIKFGEGGIDRHVIGSSPDAKWGKKSELAAATIVI